MRRRFALALALAFAFALPWFVAGCVDHPAAVDGSAESDGAAQTAFEACDTLCLKPGDCQVAYNDDGYCPAGFRCAARFTCAVDGGGED